ncbi:MAG: hypothetical protein AAF666_19115 [Pseudomonadota bacterium]
MGNLLKSLAVAAVLFSNPVAAEEPSDAAIAFAGSFSDDQLSGMLSRIGARQPTLIAMSQLHGPLVASVFDAEIDKAVEAHGTAWRRNMALAWDPLLSEGEMLSLTGEGATSPYTEKYLGLRAEAGQAMQGLSQDLFRLILAEVVQNTITELSDLGDDEQAPSAPAD